jgi:hypothetical protein
MKDDLGHAPITGVVILILKGADPGQPPVETPDKFAEGFSDARRNRGVCQRRDALPRIPDSTPTSAFTVSRRRRQPCRSSPIPRADRDYHLHAHPVFPDVYCRRFIRCSWEWPGGSRLVVQVLCS